MNTRKSKQTNKINMVDLNHLDSFNFFLFFSSINAYICHILFNSIFMLPLDKVSISDLIGGNVHLTYSLSFHSIYICNTVTLH